MAVIIGTNANENLPGTSDPDVIFGDLRTTSSPGPVDFVPLANFSFMFFGNAFFGNDVMDGKEDDDVLFGDLGGTEDNTNTLNVDIDFSFTRVIYSFGHDKQIGGSGSNLFFGDVGATGDNDFTSAPGATINVEIDGDRNKTFFFFGCDKQDNSAGTEPSAMAGDVGATGNAFDSIEIYIMGDRNLVSAHYGRDIQIGGMDVDLMAGDVLAGGSGTPDALDIVIEGNKNFIYNRYGNDKQTDGGGNQNLLNGDVLGFEDPSISIVYDESTNNKTYLSFGYDKQMSSGDGDLNLLVGLFIMTKLEYRGIII